MDFARPKSGPATPAGLDSLLLPNIPANVHTGRFKTSHVDSDVYHVAEQLKELNESLAIEVTEDTATGNKAFTITEHTPRGIEVVFRCTVLDARVVEHVRYLLHVPFQKRFAEAEKRSDQIERENEELSMNKLIEELGLPMMRELRDLGFLGEYGHGPGSDANRRRRRAGAGR